MNLNALTYEQFKELPLVIEGESKEVRYCGKGEVIIRLKPTIYSYTHNRSGVIAGSDKLRLQSIDQLLPILRLAGVHHTYKEVNDNWIRSQLVLQPRVEGQPMPFRPYDLSPEQLAALPIAPPIEVVVKAVHSGTPKHRYYGFSQHATRNGLRVSPESSYPEHFVRFDWRNPLRDTTGTRLADEVMPEPMASWFIETEQARTTAHKAFEALQRHLRTKGLALWDICLFIAEDGKTMFGEVSPDCIRVRASDGSSLDKDIWRSGGSSDTVYKKWQTFADLITTD